MLTLDPSKRPNAKQLLEHKFLTTRIDATAVSLSNNAISSLRAFRQKDKLQKVTLQMVAKYVDDKKVEDLQKMFETMDDDGNGTLSLSEMKEGLMKNDMPELAAEIEKTMDALDNDGSGLIDYSEFLAATMSRHVYLEYDYLWQVFKNFDTKDEGKLSRDDLVQVLSGGKTKKYVKGGKDEVMVEVDLIFEKYDADKSGDIDFDEFMEMMKGQSAEEKESSGLALVSNLQETTSKAMKEEGMNIRSTVLNLEEEKEVVKAAIGPDSVHIKIGDGPEKGPEIDDTGRKVGCCGFF
jgi:calcium-dependent protein kinase